MAGLRSRTELANAPSEPVARRLRPMVMDALGTEGRATIEGAPMTAIRSTCFAAAVLAAAPWSSTALASPFSLLARAPHQTHVMPASAPAGDVVTADEETAELPTHLKRQIVAYATAEAPGTIVIDTASTYLYFVIGGGHAVRYGIGVGRDGFRWSGVQTVTRKAEWPDWIPPSDMLARQPSLPRFMAGGPGNPLGARAMYLGSTVYRIHGTNQPGTIGGRVSSGCIRMTNEDVTDLYARVKLGAKVVVLPAGNHRTALH